MKLDFELVPIEYDPEADACYISLEDIKEGGVARTRCVDGDADIHLDFDAEDRLIGIDVMNAKRRLGEILRLSGKLSDVPGDIG